MKSSILISGAGAVIGQGIIKSLRKENLSFRLIGIDANPFSVGFQWADASFTVPRVEDPSWITSIIEICNKNKVLLILPGIEQDVKALLEHKDKLIKGTRALPLLNSPEALRVGFDKWELYCFAKQNEVSVPLTWLVNDISTDAITDLSYPLLLKPRRGMAGKDIYKIENRDDFDFWIRHIKNDDYILQQSIGDENEEYTVGVFGYHNGMISPPFALRRKLNYGTTFEAETIVDECMSDEVARIAKILKIAGPTNFQFRKIGNKYFLLEINPRFSSSASIKSSFGFNESLMAVNSFILGKSQIALKLKEGKCFRYISDSITFK